MDDFITFGLSHWFAIMVIIFVAVGLLIFFRSDAEERHKLRVRQVFAGLLIFAVSMDPILHLMRWGPGELGFDLVIKSALPFYLCDVVSIIAAIALITKSQRLTEVAYLWGLAGTTQGLITPTLSYDWNTLEYYNFFLQHGGVPVAAICLVWGLKIYPQKGAFKRIVLWSWAYMAIVILLNWLIGQNYGFLNHKPKFPTMFDYMGPYPYYLITLQAIAFSMYALLLWVAPKAEAE